MLFIEDASRKNGYIFVQVYPGKTFLIYWKYKPTNDKLSEHTVNIYRKLYDGADFEKIDTITADNTQYLDEYYTHNHYKVPKYALQIDDGNLSEPVSVEDHPNPDTLAIRQQVNIEIRFSGTPTLVYQRLHSGTRCPECWDITRKCLVRSNCISCFNTSYEGGFLPPILTQIRIIEPRKANQPGDTLRQKQRTMATASFYPVISPRDVLFNIHKGSMWRVETVDPSADGSALIHQDMTLDRLNPGDVEYALPIPSKLTPVIPPRRLPHGYAIDVTKGVTT